MLEWLKVFASSFFLATFYNYFRPSCYLALILSLIKPTLTLFEWIHLQISYNFKAKIWLMQTRGFEVGTTSIFFLFFLNWAFIFFNQGHGDSRRPLPHPGVRSRPSSRASPHPGRVLGGASGVAGNPDLLRLLPCQEVHGCLPGTFESREATTFSIEYFIIPSPLSLFSLKLCSWVAKHSYYRQRDPFCCS